MRYSYLVKNQKGLTIVEALVGIAIFSLVVILCLGAFVFIGRSYYKGLYETQAQEVVIEVIDSVGGALKNAGVDVISGSWEDTASSPKIRDPMHGNTYFTGATDPGLPRSYGINAVRQLYPPAWIYYCVGDTQYAWRPFHQLNNDSQPATDDSNDQRVSSFGLIVRRIPDCLAESYVFSPPAEGDDYLELLKEYMQIVRFEIKKVNNHSGRLWAIDIKIAFGNNGVIADQEQSVFLHQQSESLSLAGAGIDHLAHDSTTNEIDSDLKFICPLGLNSLRDRDVAESVYVDLRKSDPNDANSAPIEALEYYYCNLIDKCKLNESFCAVTESKAKVFKRLD